VSRKGAHSTTLWAPRLAQVVEAWNGALQQVVHENRPHTDALYDAYLRWYLPRTRRFVTFGAIAEVPHVASIDETYPRRRDQDIIGSVSI
jgi:hypothetical protein